MKQSENEERVSDQQEMAVIVDELFRGGSFGKERFLLESIAAPVTGVASGKQLFEFRTCSRQ